MKLILEGSVEHVLGTTETNATIGIVDFSRRTTDDFGVTTVVPRGFARRMSVRMAVPTDTVDSVQQILASVRAMPARWEADADFDWLNFDGFYKEFSIDLALPPLSYCTLTVEGLAQTEAVEDSGEDPATEGNRSTLWIVDPMIVTDDTLIASNVAETEHAEWSAATTYPMGERVIKAATHRVYESAVANNLNDDPEDASGKWFEVGPTNRWAMLDQALGTATSRAGSIEVTIDAYAADAVALLDVTGASVRVQADGYDQTKPVGGGAVTFLDLPAVIGAVIVTVTGPGTVMVGTLLIGQLRGLGVTEAAPSAGISDFSRKEIDGFGEVTIVERAWAKRMSSRALIRTDAVDLVANRIAAVRARPVLWIGDAELDTLTIYGFFKDFTIDVGETVSTVSISVEGLSKAAPPPPYVAPLYPDGTPIGDLQPTAPGATPGAPGGWIIGGELDPQTGEIVGGREAQSVLDDADQAVADQIVALAASVEEANRVRARLFPGEDGADVRTMFRREATARQSLASLLFVTQAALDGVVATVDLLNEAMTDGEEGYARFVLRGQVDVDGNPVSIVGIEGLAGAGGSVLRFSADSIEFLEPGSATPLIYFDTAAGEIAAETMRVRNLATNAAMIPMRAAASATISGAGSLPLNVLPLSIVMPRDGWVEAQFLGQQNFSSGDKDWSYELYIDGTLVCTASGGRTQDSVPIQGAKFCAAGTIGAYIFWRGEDTSVTLGDRSMFLKGFPGTV